jgi:hypothetical protein
MIVGLPKDRSVVLSYPFGFINLKTIEYYGEDINFRINETHMFLFMIKSAMSMPSSTCCGNMISGIGFWIK